jgi:hypothetical protein
MRYYLFILFANLNNYQRTTGYEKALDDVLFALIKSIG